MTPPPMPQWQSASGPTLTRKRIPGCSTECVSLCGPTRRRSSGPTRQDTSTRSQSEGDDLSEEAALVEDEEEEVTSTEPLLCWMITFLSLDNSRFVFVVVNTTSSLLTLSRSY